MVKYHPDVRFLTDYTAGSLPRSQALCVAAHLHFCQACKARVRELTELGSELFDQQQPLPLQTSSFERLMQRIDSSNGGATAPARQARRVPGNGDLPRAIARLCQGDVESLSWRHIGKHFRHAALKLGDVRRETTLFHIKAGGAVPHHRHGGDEITVVLKGSFSDHEDRYSAGDFIVRTQGEAHRPVASQNEDCLCLSSLDAPIQMSSWLLRLLTPFVTRFTRQAA
ncbi:MAG: ChrR family anti-sigma-E factor [Pseudohongiellaceae bacterium]